MASAKSNPADRRDDHWLVREETIRWLWVGSAIGLTFLVTLDLVIEHHPHFGVDGWFGFGAWFGFLSCGGLIAFAKLLGVFLKRPDEYYGD
jgi:hypothetical protein